MRADRRLDARSAEMCVRCAREVLEFGVIAIGERGAQLPLDDCAADLERREAQSADPRADSTCAREAEPLDRRDRSAQCRVFRAMCERRLRDRCNRGHVVAHFVLSPAAFTACSNPSIVAVSGKSRCTRVRPAFPMAIRFSSTERNDATADAGTMHRRARAADR
jgi:hypothetical protein